MLHQRRAGRRLAVSWAAEPAYDPWPPCPEAGVIIAVGLEPDSVRMRAGAIAPGWMSMDTGKSAHGHAARCVGHGLALVDMVVSEWTSGFASCDTPRAGCLWPVWCSAATDMDIVAIWTLSEWHVSGDRTSALDIDTRAVLGVGSDACGAHGVRR